MNYASVRGTTTTTTTNDNDRPPQHNIEDFKKNVCYPRN